MMNTSIYLLRVHDSLHVRLLKITAQYSKWSPIYLNRHAGHPKNNYSGTWLKYIMCHIQASIIKLRYGSKKYDAR